MEDEIINLTVQIVSAHVANSDVTVQQLPVLIRTVHQALATAEQAAIEPKKPQPVVAATKSIFADHIVCLDCGGRFKMLKPHLKADHQMTPEAYRTKWELPPSYPIVAPEYAAVRSKAAKASGFGRKMADSSPPPKTRGRPRKS